MNFPRRDGGTFVIVRQTAGLGGDTLEDIVDEAVHDGHGLTGDAGVRVDLLENLVYVDGVSLATTTVSLLLVGTGLDSLFGFARRHRLVSFRSHITRWRVFTRHSTNSYLRGSPSQLGYSFYRREEGREKLGGKMETLPPNIFALFMVGSVLYIYY